MKKFIVIFLLSIIVIGANARTINFSIAAIGKIHQSQLTIPIIGLQIGGEYKKYHFTNLFFVESDLGWSLKDNYQRSIFMYSFLVGDKMSYAIGSPVYSLEGTYNKTFWFAPSLELGYTNENVNRKEGEEKSHATINYFYLTPGVDFNLIIAKKIRLVIAVGEGIFFNGNTSSFKGIYSKIGNVEYAPQLSITLKY